MDPCRKRCEWMPDWDLRQSNYSPDINLKPIEQLPDAFSDNIDIPTFGELLEEAWQANQTLD